MAAHATGGSLLADALWHMFFHAVNIVGAHVSSAMVGLAYALTIPLAAGTLLVALSERFRDRVVRVPV